MRLRIEMTGTQTVELDVPDEDVARYGMRAVAEEAGSAQWDDDVADWDFYAEQIAAPPSSSERETP